MIDGGDYRTGYQRACDNEHVEAQAEVKRLKERLAVVVEGLEDLLACQLQVGNTNTAIVLRGIITLAETHE